jgi:NADPH:quinone reductase-like Zn-dependent oxidoreductase
MKAVRIHGYGDREVLTYEDAPHPQPGPGEVLIRVHATSVNPFDCFVHAGYAVAYFDYTLPLISGSDVAGEIAAVGEGVTGWRPDDRVYTRAGVWRDGAHAEYVVAFAADVAALPQSLDYVHAAAIPHVVLMGHAAISSPQPRRSAPHWSGSRSWSMADGSAPSSRLCSRWPRSAGPTNCSKATMLPARSF